MEHRQKQYLMTADLKDTPLIFWMTDTECEVWIISLFLKICEVTSINEISSLVCKCILSKHSLDFEVNNSGNTFNNRNFMPNVM